MHFLAIDHFFEQDLAALREALRTGESLDVIPYQRLHRLARRYFPADAFDGLDAAVELPETTWMSYRTAADGMANWLAGAYRPNVAIVPTDAIFYLRPVIERLARLGVPTVVVQKETSISPMVMEDHSAAVGRTVPFLSAAMTVCSERNREFWIRAGTAADAIVVTGQPRFDVYAQPSSGRGSVAPATGPARLLYLSYDDVAYLPSDVGVPFEGTWRQLREETEEVLAEAAAGGRWRVTVKLHPQQRMIGDRLGPLAKRSPRGADTRRLILAADAVVAFQTTAIYEAVVAGKPVLYPAWGPVFEMAAPFLLPFHRQPGAVIHLRGPGELAAALAAPPADLRRPTAEGREAAEEQLGHVDGRAAERVLSVVRRFAGSGPVQCAAPDRRRVLRAAGLGLASPGLRAAGTVADRVGKPTEAGAARRRADHWAQEGREALAIIRRR